LIVIPGRVNRVADYVREWGFNAHPAPTISGEVNCIPLTIDAGPGISGKNGLLITPGNGPRVCLAALFTGIEFNAQSARLDT